MNTFQIILLVVTVLLGYPVGRFIAANTKEELKAGKIWFKLIILICLIGIFASLIFIKGDNLISLIASFIFIILMIYASLKYKGRRK